MAGARRYAEKLRAALEAAGLRASAGVACYPGDGPTADALLDAADRRLYRAKAAGRNRVAAPQDDRGD